MSGAVAAPETAGAVYLMAGPQTDFVASEARYPAFLAGRRSGKTVASIVKMVKYVNEHPGARGAFTLPTLGDIHKIFLPTMDDLFGALKGQAWDFLEKRATLVFPDLKAEVFIRPAAEPETLRGPTLSFAVMDEIGVGDQQPAFRILQPAITKAGFPHQLWVTSTPRVEARWIAQIWRDGINPMSGKPLPHPHNYPTFRTRTINNTHLDPLEIEELVAEWGGSRWAMQELDGEFIAVEGVAFPELLAEVHLRHPHEGIEFTKSVVGLDFGATSPTALIEWKMDRSKRLWATAEFYKRDATDYDWIAWCRDRNVNKIICDPSAAERDLDFYRRSYGINIQRSRIKNFDDRARLWRSRLAVKEDNLPGLYISPSCPNLWDEMINLQFHKPRGHDYAADAFVPGSSDHAYDAGAYGLGEFEAGARGRPIQALVFQRRVA